MNNQRFTLNNGWVSAQCHSPSEYYNELGLTTHRAANTSYNNPLKFAETQHRIAPRNSSLLNRERNSTHFCLFDNNNDDKWWQVPSPARNYEQKFRKVSVAFSINEIYSQAKIKDESQPEQHDTETIPDNAYGSSALRNHGDFEDAYDDNTSIEEESYIPSTRPNDLRKQRSNDLLKQSLLGLHNDLMQASYSNRQNASLSSAGKEYLSYSHQQAPIQRCKQETLLHSPNKQQHKLNPAYHVYNLQQHEKEKESHTTDKVHYRTFDEARIMYPTSDDSEADESLTDNNQTNDNDGVNYESALVAVEQQLTSPLETSAVVSQDKTDAAETKDTEQCAQPTQLTTEQLEKLYDVRIAPEARIDSWITSLHGAKDETAAVSQEQQDKTDGPENNKVSDAYVNKVLPKQLESTPRIMSKATQPAEKKQRHMLTLSLQSSQSLTAPGIPSSSSSDDDALPQSTIVPKNRVKSKSVPPIDLSLLSPKKSKSTQPKSSNEVQKSASKKSASKKLIGSTKRQNVESKLKTKQIAAEIKKRVSSNYTREDKSSQTKKSDSSKCIKVESPRSILTSYRGYDKYKAMSPNINSGDFSVWQCLPDELWLHIINFLPLKDLHSLMLVCQEFCRIAHDRSLWRNVSVYRKKLSDDDLLRIASLEPVNLTISQSTGQKLNGDIVTNKGLMTLFSACGNKLTSVTVSSCVQPPLSGEAMLHHCALHCVNVTYVDASWCNITDREVSLVCESFNNLTALLLNGNQTLTDESVEKIAEQYCNQIQHLELAGCFKITNASLHSITTCSQLKTLNIGQCHKLTASTITSALSQLHEIQSLTMKGLKQLRDSCMVGIVNRCSNITHLNLSQCTGITQKSLLEISCSLSNLRSLDVSSCKNCVNDASISALLANCNSLVTLDLSSTGISNHSVSNLATSCASLSELKLNFCSVSETGITHLLEKAGNMQKLQVYGVRGLSTDHLRASFTAVQIEQ